MAFEPKILLTIKLEGGSLHRGEEVIVKTESKDAKGHVKKRSFRHRPLEANEATLTCKLCKEAYDAMTDPKDCPAWFVQGNTKASVGYANANWKKLKNKERLELHLARICAFHNGKSFTYEILED